MGALKFAKGANYKRFYSNLKIIAKEEKKSAPLMFIDSALCTVIFGSGLTDYLNYKFYKRSFAEKKRYATIRVQDKFYSEMNPAEHKKVFAFKPLFMEKFADFIGRGYFDPEKGSVSELKAFLDKNPVFVQKPCDGLGGGGVQKRNAEEISDVEEYYNFLKSGRMFLDELIVQHERISNVCPASVNTIRIVTSIASGTPVILYAALRVGNGKVAVDNFHSGGMGIEINLETGRLMGEAVDKNLNRFEAHPLTGIKFDGYQLPFWDEVKATVCKAAYVEPRIKVVGWDVALTENGPVFVEANRRSGFDMIQVLNDRGRKDIVDEVRKAAKKSR